MINNQTSTSNTIIDKWTVKELVDARNGIATKKRLIRIPTYQRNLVWKDEQKKQLIKSIKNWFPIGAMLLYKAKNEDWIDIYHLIDGLQRSTALKKYLEEPASFLDLTDLPQWIHEELLEIAKKYNSVEGIEDRVSDIIKRWLGTLKWFDKISWFSPIKLIEELNKEFPDMEKSYSTVELMNLVSKLEPYFEEIKTTSSIDHQEIPMLIYTWDSSNLPIIFEKLNHGWTQLSKYQVFAATWSLDEYYIKIANKDIVKKIIEKYNSLQEEHELTLEIPGEINTDSQFNYFEYFFGLGKHLTEKYRADKTKWGLFDWSKKSDDTESIWFNLWALCLTKEGDIKKMKNLAQEIHTNKIDLDKFSDAIDDAVSITWSILQPYIWIKANARNLWMTEIYHSEMQIVSIIWKIFNSKYQQKTFEIKSDWKEKERILKEHIPYVYLYHIMKWYWSGTGDSKANESASVTNKTYEEKITREQWDWLFNELKIYEEHKNEKERAKASPVSILIFKYIYGKIITQHDVLIGHFEIEHLCPVARLKEFALKNWWIPISALWNLCLIEKDLNRDKREKTFYEYYDRLVEQWEITSTEKESELKMLEEKRIFTTRKDLAFSSDFREWNIADYINFINKRFDIIRDKFYSLNWI